MDTTFLKNLPIDDLNILLNACQTELGDRKTEKKNKLMNEFDDWLARVHKAGFEPIENQNDILLDYWNVDLIDDKEYYASQST